MSESKVKVAVRVRPLLSHEKSDGATSCVDVHSEAEVIVGGNKQFTFDYVFGPEMAQIDVYETAVYSLVENLFEGYNATIFAYGQTGSGKTFTMGSGCAVPGLQSEDELGIIPRALNDVFNKIAAAKAAQPGNEYYLRVQFLELYGETLRDLLDPVGSAQGKRIQIRDGEGGSLQVTGALEESVKTLSDTLAVLERGTLSRTTGSTAMNLHSSRSHAIFTLVLEQQIRPGDGSDGADVEFRISKFHFVDLAGSERAKRTGASGVRFREGVDINMGLLALGNVISALGDETNQVKFVNYRDSKLTRILQDSLGGNSRTLMVACVNPADSSFEETLNALRYANRARNIKNRAVINRDPSSSLIAALKAEVNRLKLQLERAGMSQTPLSTTNGPESPSRIESKQRLMYENEVDRLVRQLDSETKLRRTLEDRVSLLEAERKALLGSVSGASDDGMDEQPHDMHNRHKSSSTEAAESYDDVCSIVSSDDENCMDGEDNDLLTLASLATSREGFKDGDVDSEAASHAAEQEMRRKFEQSQRALRQLVTRYDETLKSKESAMREMATERAKFDAFKAHFEAKMREMNEEVKQIRKEREQLKQKLSELENAAASPTALEDAAKIRQQLIEKEARLRELEDKARQLEITRRAALEWQKREAHVRAEIDLIRREKTELSKRLAENQKRHLEELAERRLEIAGLERERMRLERDTAALSEQVSKSSKVIQAKSTQVAAMQKRLRDALKRVGVSSQDAAQAERDRKQREEIERLAAAQVAREEELLALRRALAKKELAILRRQRLVEKLERLRLEQKEREDEEAKKNAAGLHSGLSGAAREDVLELEQRLEALDSEIVFRDRECQMALEGRNEEGTSNAPGGDTTVFITLNSLDHAQEVCRLLMEIYIEGKKENRELRSELEQAQAKLDERDMLARMERRRAEALIFQTDSDFLIHQDQHVPSTPRLTKSANLEKSMPDLIPAIVPNETSEDLARMRIQSLEEKLKSLQAMPEKSEGLDRDGGKPHQEVFERLTSPSAYTGIHKYGQRDFLRVHKDRRGFGHSKSASPAKPPPFDARVVGTISSDEDEGGQLKQEAEESPQTFTAGWERVAALTTESFLHKRSQPIGFQPKVSSTKRSTWRPKRPSISSLGETTPQQITSRSSVTPGSVSRASQVTVSSSTPMSNTPSSSSVLSSSRLPVHERLSDPRSFTGTQRYVHDSLLSSEGDSLA